MDAPIGRSRELERLGLLLDAAPSGAALLLRGPRGVGVSALLEAGAARAAERGMPVLRAAGAEAESGFPYAGLHQLLRPLRRVIAARPPGDALRALEDAPPPAAVAAALADIAAEPLLVCVDDVQWIDEQTRATLAALPLGCPVALLLGGHGDDAWPSAEALAVGPLDPVAAAALLDAAAPDLGVVTRDRILRAAAGYPLALAELPAAFANADDDLLGPWAPLTPALGAAFGAPELPPDAAHALLIAALNDGGRVADVAAALVQGGAGEAPAAALAPDAVAALAPAAALGLIDVDGDRLTFAHPLIRSAVRRAADPAARAAGHAAIAAAVAGRDPDRAVWHRVAASSGVDAGLAAPLEAVSWRAREAGDYERAAAGMRRAALLTPPGPERGGRLVAAAELAHEIGAVELGERLVEEVVADELDALGRARLGALRAPRDVRTLVPLARDAAAHGEPELAMRLLWRAATESSAAALDAAPEVALAPGLLAIVAALDAEGREAELLAGVRAQAGTATRPGELLLLGQAALTTGAPHLAAGLLDRAVRGLRAQRRRTPLGQALALSAWARLLCSDFDRAATEAEEAVWLTERVRRPIWGALANAALATVAALRGDEEAAERRAAAAERVALPARARFVLSSVQHARGLLALGAGRPAEAFAHLRRPFDPTDPAFDPAAATMLGDLAEAATTDSERAAVRALLAAPAPSPRAGIAVAHAVLVLAEDAEAEAAFAAAAVRIGAQWPFPRARMLLVHGMRLRRARRMADSRAPLREAVSGFEALGAVPWAERARRELAATVETVRRGEDHLTPRELEIARMAARGMTNRAIADDLALSPRTVGHHLARIFPKLDVSSRATIGAALERAGY